MERLKTAAAELAAREILPQIRYHAPFLCLALGVLIASEILKFRLASVTPEDFLLLVTGPFLFTLLLIPALLPMIFFRVGVFEKAASPLRGLAAGIRNFVMGDGRLMRGLAMLLAVYLFMAGFATFKALIPSVQPFAWDALFDQWDRALHFGYRPWELLQPILGYPPVSALININYNFWFISLSMFWLHFAFEEKPGVLRSQAILSFMLTWTVGGVFLAMFFSSAGPCYFGKLGLGYDPYAGLMTYLHTTSQSWPIWSMELQDTLWENYSSSVGGDMTKGISAMPSMHNSQSLLLVLATWNKHKLVRNLAIGHGLLVFLGSVLLGWHYAVDAYVAVVIAAVAWAAAGCLARAWEARHAISLAASRP